MGPGPFPLTAPKLPPLKSNHSHSRAASHGRIIKQRSEQSQHIERYEEESTSYLAKAILLRITRSLWKKPPYVESEMLIIMPQ